MTPSSALYAVSVIAALAVGFIGGSFSERYLARVYLAPVTASPPASKPPTPTYSLATAEEFSRWLSYRASQKNEPILTPAALSAVIYPCGETPSACSAQREAFQKTVDRLRTNPKLSRDVAMCMLEGCDGAVAVLPTNACLWWSFYIVRFPNDKGAIDDQKHRAACGRADFGSTQRKAELAGLWEEAALRATGLAN